MALSTNEKPLYARTINQGVGVLNAATAGAMGSDTNGVTIYTAGSNGGRVESLVLNSDDTAAVNVFIYLYISSTVYPLGIVNVPASSGNTSAAANVDALLGTGVTLIGQLKDPTFKSYISIPASGVLKMSCLANMTAAKKCYATAQGFDY